MTTSVCTGALLLAKAGLLDGIARPPIGRALIGCESRTRISTVVDDVRVVDEGKIVTSAGVSAGIDMALHIVARMHGQEAAVKTARDMEYRWEPAL